ncbi:MAG: hypothetical protein VX589_00215 [Myxococcota bacterium]|nr:hypothetical protein [Myxococcota bacterium]
MSKHECVSDEMLAAYFDGQLSEAQEAEVHREMAKCSSCSELLASLGVVIHEAAMTHSIDEVPDALTQRAMDLMPEPTPESKPGLLRLAVKWIEDTLAPLAESLQPLELTAGTVRGAAAARQDAFEELRFHVNLGRLSLELDLEVDGPQEVSLTVKPMSAPPAGLLLRLANDGTTRAVSSLGAVGATVVALPVGHYDLTLEHGGQELGAIRLELHT